VSENIIKIKHNLKHNETIKDVIGIAGKIRWLLFPSGDYTLNGEYIKVKDTKGYTEIELSKITFGIKIWWENPGQKYYTYNYALKNDNEYGPSQTGFTKNNPLAEVVKIDKARLKDVKGHYVLTFSKEIDRQTYLLSEGNPRHE